MRLILLGPPGSGKGTQAKLLCRRMGLEHIGTGDIIRAAMENHTPVGVRARPFVETGNLVPDDLVNDLIAEHFQSSNKSNQFVMDGYPRTLSQARSFDELLLRKRLPLSKVLLLDVGDDEIIRRVSGRWSCPKKGCKATYHTEKNPPKNLGHCDDCSTPLVQRSDDKPETVRARLVVYHRDTAELIPYYRSQRLLQVVAGHGEIEQVYQELEHALSGKC